MKDLMFDTLRMQQILQLIRVEAVFSRHLLIAEQNWSVRQLSRFFVENNISGAPVVAENQKLVGVVTQSDVVKFECSPLSDEDILSIIESYCGPTQRPIDEAEIENLKNQAVDYCTVESLMTRTVHSVDTQSTLLEAMELILDKEIHRLFITENGVLVGVMSAVDILKHLTTSPFEPLKREPA